MYPKFMTPSQIRKNDIGLSYEEHLEMSYENLLQSYKQAVKEIAKLHKENERLKQKKGV